MKTFRKKEEGKERITWSLPSSIAGTHSSRIRTAANTRSERGKSEGGRGKRGERERERERESEKVRERVSEKEGLNTAQHHLLVHAVSVASSCSSRGRRSEGASIL